MKRAEYIEAVGNMRMPAGMEERLRRSVMGAEAADCKRPAGRMPKGRVMAVIAVAAALLMGTAAYAAGSGLVKSWFSADAGYYDSLPGESRCMRDCGFVPVLIEEFQNGYAYHGGYRDENQLLDEANSAVEKFYSFRFIYANNADTVSFAQVKSASPAIIRGKLADTAAGVDIYSGSAQYLLVPEDYEATPEERSAVDRGELYISYGAVGEDMPPDRQTLSSVEWYDGGIHCIIQQMGGALSEAELTAMAREAIAAG